jgi:hypothetical protein
VNFVRAGRGAAAAEGEGVRAVDDDPWRCGKRGLRGDRQLSPAPFARGSSRTTGSPQTRRITGWGNRVCAWLAGGRTLDLHSEVGTIDVAGQMRSWCPDEDSARLGVLAGVEERTNRTCYHRPLARRRPLKGAWFRSRDPPDSESTSVLSLAWGWILRGGKREYAIPNLEARPRVQSGTTSSLEGPQNQASR